MTYLYQSSVSFTLYIIILYMYKPQNEKYDFKSLFLQMIQLL